MKNNELIIKKIITMIGGDGLKKLNDVDLFLNDNYQVLMVLYSHQQEVNGNVFTAITQQEIADNMDFSLMKINAIINKLKKAGYVNSYKNSRGRYKLTDKAYCLINTITMVKGEKKNGKKE